MMRSDHLWQYSHYISYDKSTNEQRALQSWPADAVKGLEKTFNVFKTPQTTAKLLCCTVE